jgi:hypothetical protein
MAIKYGISDRRSGKVGDLVFSITSNGNVVKERVIKVNDAKSIGQVEQRSKLANGVKALKNISPKFLKKCFEDKKKGNSFSNSFIQENILGNHVMPFFKKYTDDPNVMGIGNFALSKGSLTPAPVVEFVANDVTYYGIKLKDDTVATDNATVGNISTALTELYPTVFKAGNYVNGIGVYNTGVSYKADDEDPIQLDNVYNVKTTYANFIVKNNDDTKIKDKGFFVMKDTDNHVYLTLSKDKQNFEVNLAVKKTQNYLGYCGFIVAAKNGSKVIVSTENSHITQGLDSLITHIQNHPVQIANGWLSTVMTVLIVLSYGVKKTIEIIRDWPI